MIPGTTMTLPVDAVVQRLKAVFSSPHRDDSHRLAELVPILRQAHPNMLVVGPAAETDRMFEQMREYLRGPIASWVPRESPHPPTMSYRTLVVRDVDGLNAVQQESLVSQLCRTAGDVQVVAISGAPLFPLIKRGVFLDRLYYQLNVVLLDVRDDRRAS
jgi:hypothetical protein